jgi:hypothetical protein
MNEFHANLARQLVKSPHWKWTAGMLVTWPNGNEFRVAQVSGIDGVNDTPNYPANGWGDEYPDRTAGLPHLEDPATLGCVLDLTRQRLSDPSWRPYPVSHDPSVTEWIAWRPSQRRQTLYPTEVAAVVAVLTMSSETLQFVCDL